MALLQLRIVPDPVLRRKTRHVRDIDASIQRLVDDMRETMRFEHGIGLAANQGGVLHRVAVIHLPEAEEPIILINPEVLRREGQREVEEGCLSIPGYRAMLFRSVTVRVKAQDRDGKPFRIKAQELLAQALEHEIDHLNGVLYIDHIDDPAKLVKSEQEGQQPVEAAAAERARNP